MAHIFYKRVSTKQNQTTARQLINTGITPDFVYEDKMSGKNLDRPEYQRMMNNVKEGDTVHFHSLDRAVRSMKGLLTLVEDFKAKGVKVVFHKENINLDGNANSPMDNLLLNLLGAIAEFERQLINERVKEGVAVAKENGVKFGAANPKYNAKQRDTKNEAVRLAAKNKWEPKRKDMEGILAFMTSNKVKRTYANIAKSFEQFGLTNASGLVKWTPSQAQRAMEILGIGR